MYPSPARFMNEDLSESDDPAAELTALIRQQIGEMPPQLQVAARFVLERPQDVALMSMRLQAQTAGVSHSTMMRLAEWFGLSGYAAFRQAFAGTFRRSVASGGSYHHAPDREMGIAAGITSSVAQLSNPSLQMQISNAAVHLRKARRIVCAASSQEALVVRHAARLFTALQARVETIEGDSANTEPYPVWSGGCEVCLLVISFAPHQPFSIDIAREASRCGVHVIAMVDDPDSVVARFADSCIFLPATPLTPALPSLTPGIAAVEALAFLWEDRARV